MHCQSQSPGPSIHLRRPEGNKDAAKGARALNQACDVHWPEPHPLQPNQDTICCPSSARWHSHPAFFLQAPPDQLPSSAMRSCSVRLSLTYLALLDDPVPGMDVSVARTCQPRYAIPFFCSVLQFNFRLQQVKPKYSVERCLDFHKSVVQMLVIFTNSGCASYSTTEGIASLIFA